MRLNALTRTLLVIASLVTGLGQPVSALAHGHAHAHEAEHRASAVAIDAHGHEHGFGDGIQRDLAPDAHHHEHQHAIVEAGLKSRPDVLAFAAVAASESAHLLTLSVEQEAPYSSTAAPPAGHRHTPASPRAPPTR